jgi:hypothetical protein
MWTDTTRKPSARHGQRASDLGAGHTYEHATRINLGAIQRLAFIG